MKHPKPLLLAMSILIVVSIGYTQECSPAISMNNLNSRLNKIAESYVKLVLAVGQHDSNYVDAYYGPQEWLTAARQNKKPLNVIEQRALSLAAELDSLNSTKEEEEVLQLRLQYLKKQLSSLIARVEVLGGKKLTFDEEAKAYYDVTPPTFSDEHFLKLIAELDSIVPGTESLSERIDKFRKQFIIPSEKLDTVFRAAIFECRARTKKHIALPENENFKLEYVHHKSWGGYNWYKGNSQSLIQINLDSPAFLERAIDLAAHEGYPGHHVYNCLLETEFTRKRGWVEFTTYALFSPQSLIAEGTANFGIDVAFPGKQRMEFERDALCPLAGLDGNQAEIHSKIQALIAKLSYANNEAARRYLNGEFSREKAVQWLIRYGAMTLQRAQRAIDFIDQYRSYVINYNLGEDLVKQYIERQGGTIDKPEKRWEEFKKLISSPRLPSGLL
jgi:hypothetical protein